MQYFLKRLLGFSLGPVIGALISIVQIPILTRLMMPDQYGVSGLFRSLLLYVPNILYLGLDQAFAREYHQTNDKKQLFQTAVCIPLLLALILAGGMFVFRGPIAQWLFSSDSYGYVISLSCVLLLSVILERFVLLAIRMEEKAKEYSFFSILLKLLIFVLSLVFIFMGLRDFRVIVYGIIGGQMIGDLILFYRYKDLLQISHFEWDQDLLKMLLLFGLPLMLAMSLNSILNMVDNVLLNSLSTKQELGIYTAGMGIVNVIGILKTAFATFWTPTAYRWYEEGKSIKHFKFISDALLFLLSGMFFAILIFRPVIMLLLGAHYRPAQAILGLLCFPHIMYTLSETTTLGIVFSRKTYFNIFVSILALIPSVGLNFLLTPSLGALGAAFASCGAYIMFYMARTYFSKQTGFYFSQRKHFLAILLMFLAALVNAFVNSNERFIYYFFLAVACLFVQWPTIRTAYSIWKNSDEWDFN